MSITAVIPTHNRPEQLKRAVQSVLSQESLPDEVNLRVVVVDDGSQPPVDSTCLPPIVEVVRNEEPQGPAKARNAGAAAVRTEWIGFLDDDDIWLPGKVKAVLDAASQFREAGIICHGSAWRPSRVEGPVRQLQEPLTRVLHQQPPHISGVAVRTSIHARHPFDETMWASQDLDYLIRLAQSADWIEIDRDLSEHGYAGPKGSAIDIDSRIAGRLSLLDRHGSLIQGDPEAHSFFLVRLGHQYRRGDQYDNARATFLRALRLKPSSGLAWRGLMRSILRM